MTSDLANRLGALLQAGDHIVWTQGTAEPLTLTRLIVENRKAWGPFSIFVGATFSNVLRADNCDGLTVSSYGAIGQTRGLIAAGALDVRPINAVQLGNAIMNGHIGCDVAVVQLSPPGPNGKPSAGLVNDYIRAAMKRARIVIAEINDQVPWTYGPEPEGLDKIALAIDVSYPPQCAPAKAPTDVEREIAAHAAGVIRDGATLQVGIGGTIDALLQFLSDRRDLGIHSGMIGDGVLDLIERGAVTNARKPIDRGLTITANLFGSAPLFRWADRNPALEVRPYDYTHDPAVLSRLPNLVAVNAAVEVDITGAANAETVGGRYVGGVGGQLDFMHAAARAPDGGAMIVLPSTAAGGRISRIRPSVEAVTCPRSDVDFVVTEFGLADLRGCTLRQRMQRMLAIADPTFHDELDREAAARIARGF